MQRVTSRQRLFSWDQFDANADCSSSSDEDSDYITCLGASSRNTSFALDDDDDDYYHDDDTCESGHEGILIIPRGLSTPPDVTLSPHNDTPSRTIDKDTPTSIKRTNANGTTIKKSVSFSNLIANKKVVLRKNNLSPRSSIQQYYHGTSSSNPLTPKATPSSTSVLTLMDLNCDTQFDVVSFLTAEEVQCVGMSCHYFNNMLLVIGSSLSPNEQTSSVARNTIWWSFMKKKWPHLSLLSRGSDTNRDTDITNPTRSSAQIVFIDNRTSPEKMNFGALLKQAPTDMPPSQIASRFYVTPSSVIPTPTEAQTPNLPTTHLTTDLHYPSSTEAMDAIQKPPFACYRMKTPFFSNLRLCPQTKSDDNDDTELNGQSDQRKQNEFQHTNEQMGTLEEIIQVIQFTGSVGTGDRSVRADQPFPLPLESIPVFKSLASTYLVGNDDKIPALANKIISSNSTNNEVFQKINNASSSSDSTHMMITRRRKRKGRNGSSSSLPFPISPFSSSNVVVPSPRRAFLEMLERCRNCHARCFCSKDAADQVQNTGENVINTTTTKSSARSIPFVSPFVVGDPTTVVRECSYPIFKEIDLTPRMVAYFEVSVLLRDKMQEPEINEIGQSSTTSAPRMLLPRHYDAPPNFGRPQTQQQRTRQHVSECIAVGLSLKSSMSRMPGWDKSSYGYHGDDGGIFHSRGEMIRAYGPKYGEGDTVGCGVNYENGGIFFTLNGNFLGYAWCSLRVVQEGRANLYPTVGVDSNCPLVSNFGNVRPFHFDLAGFVSSKGSVPTHTT